MQHIIRKPYPFFFSLTVLFIIISFFRKDIQVDITIYDTFFAVSVPYLCYLSAAFFGLVGANYYVLHWVQKHPKKLWTSAHLFLQVISLILYLYFIFSLSNNQSLLANPSAINNSTSLVLKLSVILFIIATIVHFINFFISLFAKQE
jgi:uncharacterized membrane protein (DUF485 family)